MEGLLRKGTWSKVEDELLTACVEQYGEGKWHLVPIRTGLNRCRKSCRLRWLNYLKPSIKRGKFTEDEIDMMKRLHKLLGNRWSLIAGRLPGRTPNDVKNYWNTHIHKRVLSSNTEEIRITNANAKQKEIMKPHLVIKPQPQTLSITNSPMLKMKAHNKDQRGPNQGHTQTLTTSISKYNDNNLNDKWWGPIMDHDNGGNVENNGKCFVQDGMFMNDINLDELIAKGFIEDQSWSDFLIDNNFLDL